MNISSLVWKYEIVSELCSGNYFGTDGRNDGMTDGRTTPKPVSPFHFVAGDNKWTGEEETGKVKDKGEGRLQTSNLGKWFSGWEIWSLYLGKVQKHRTWEENGWSRKENVRSLKLEARCAATWARIADISGTGSGATVGVWSLHERERWRDKETAAPSPPKRGGA